MRSEGRFCSCALAIAGALMVAGGVHADDFVAFGLDHVLLGNADASLENGTLTISNLGSSGQDGVSIAEPNAMGYATAIDFDAMVIPPNGGLAGKVLVLQGGTVQSAGTLTMTTTPSGMAYAPEIGGPQEPYTLLGWHEGEQVVEVGGLTGAGGQQLSPPSGTVHLKASSAGFHVAFEEPVTYEAPDGDVTIVDAIRFVPVEATILPDRFDAFELTGVFYPEIVIESTAIANFAPTFEITALDDGHLAIEPDGALAVSNFGSSGCDGFRIDLGPQTEVVNLGPEYNSVELWMFPELALDPDGAADMSTVVSIETNEGVSLDNAYGLTATYEGDQMAISPNWGALDIPWWDKCAIYIDGFFSGCGPCSDWLMFSMAVNVNIGTGQGPDDMGYTMFASVDFPQPNTLFDESGAAVYENVTRIEYLGDNPPHIPAQINDVEVSAGNMLSLTVADFTTTQDEPCLADFNQDGSTSILDFIAFQQAFQNQDPAADINDDGVWNILDFIAFQNAFQQGCE